MMQTGFCTETVHKNSIEHTKRQLNCLFKKSISSDRTASTDSYIPSAVNSLTIGSSPSPVIMAGIFFSVLSFADSVKQVDFTDFLQYRCWGCRNPSFRRSPMCDERWTGYFEVCGNCRNDRTAFAAFVGSFVQIKIYPNFTADRKSNRLILGAP